MQASEIREMSEEELEQRMIETRKELFNLKMQQSTGQLEKPSRIKDLRRDIARMNGISSERKIATR